MKTLFFLLLSTGSFMSCNSSSSKIFGTKKTPHEAHADKIVNKPAGKQWLGVSKNVLTAAQPIQLPYSLLGSFPAGKPRAGVYILRLQPALEQSGEYRLSVSVGPSLGFPVAGEKARVGGVWGDSRDGGKRSHEGIDIFATKLTPAIAAADGYISRVNDGGLGGKTVNLKVTGRNLSLYYAHLDKQLVQEGQEVKKGDTLGLVGNTGNAKTTSPHLHFGIYSFGGPIDPLPYVNKMVKKAPAPVAKNIPGQLALTQTIKTKTEEKIAANTLLIPLGLSAEGYIAELPDGNIISAPLKSVKIVKI